MKGISFPEYYLFAVNAPRLIERFLFLKRCHLGLSNNVIPSGVIFEYSSEYF